MPRPSKFLFSEARLSELTGINRKYIIKLRQEMEPGTHWRKSKTRKGKPIELTQAAVDIILKTFGLSGLEEAVTADVPAKSTVEPVIAPVTNGLVELKVTGFPINTRLVLARNGDGKDHFVIVEQSKYWSVGDPLRARPATQSFAPQGYLELVGPAPRWKGDKLYKLS